MALKPQNPLITQWHTSSSKTTLPKPPRTPPPTGNQAFRCLRLSGNILFKLPDVLTVTQPMCPEPVLNGLWGGVAGEHRLLGACLVPHPFSVLCTLIMQQEGVMWPWAETSETNGKSFLECSQILCHVLTYYYRMNLFLGVNFWIWFYFLPCTAYFISWVAAACFQRKNIILGFTLKEKTQQK